MTKSKFGKPLCRLIMAVAMMMLSLQAMAYDFSYTHQGKTLYYDIISDSTVEVTYYDNSNYVSGDVVIPSTVTYNGTTYSVTSIGEVAFYDCIGLTSVTIGNSVTSIERSAFSGCSGLTSINVASGNTHYSSIDGVLYNYVQDTLIQCPVAKTSVTIPNSVTSIGDEAFYGCSGLTSVTIPNSVTSIGDYAFSDCSSLTSITIPNSVTSIGWNAFWGCSGLTSVTIGNSVTSIGGLAFYGCSGLTSVTIPNSVTSIERYAFEGCSGLTSVSIPNSVTSIGGKAFYACSGLTSVTIGNSVTSIGGLAFSGCSGLTTLNFNAINCQDFDYAYAPFGGTSLTTVNIGDSVQRIPANFVRGCSGLTSVTIGNSLTSIGYRAFYECLNLSSLISLATVPPTIGNEAFPYPNICTVTVPCGSLAAYTASTCYWSVYFPQRITAGFPFELNISANDSTLGTVVITTGESCAEGVLTAIPELCYRFVAWNDGNTTNPRTITLTQDTTLTANFERAVYTQEIHHAICEGSVYTENGFNVSEAGTYTQNLQTIDGCDSIVTLTLTVNPVESTTLSAAICEGSTYTENGFNVSEAGTYTQNLQTINGCDSIVTLTLTVNPVENTNLTAAICEGTTYTENGFNVSEAGTYTQNLQTIDGCDSIVTLNLTINPVANTTLSAAICDGTTYTENGFNVSEAGTYTQNLQTVNGCDSIVTLNLTVNPIESTNLTAAICEGTSYTENGFNVSEAGTYTQNLQTINGCDSIVTLTLSVNPVANTTLSAAICEGTTYTENGFNVSEAGTYTQNLQTINGCDSIVTLTLSVNPVESTTLSAAICEGTTYTENGFNVSEAGTYTQNLQTVNGCDSIVTLTLTVNPVESTTLSAAICDGTTYTENGFNVSEAGTYTQNLQTVNGCDSIVTLTLTVNPVESTTLSAAICEGTTYTENGFNVSEAGTYTQNLQTVNGCDSIVTLTLTVNPVANTTLSVTICNGTTYTENGFNVSEAGTYTQNLQTVNGCDSIVTLNLTINPTYNITIDASINEGETYEANGFSESEAGTYVHTLQSEFGCDSVITLNLTVNSSLNDVVANAIEVSLYPNPARAYTMLKVEGLKEQTPVYLFDIQGRKLKEYVLNAAQQTLRIDASDLPKGVYTIMIGSTTKKLIVE